MATDSATTPGWPWQRTKKDLMASIVVFLVALPLCMGISIASGVDPARGLITGIIGGLIVGFISGCPLQVSGPAAGLTVIVYELIRSSKERFLAQQGNLEALGESTRQALEAQAMQYAIIVMGLVVFLGGLLQLLAAFCKLGRWFRAVSPAVIRGMLAGIGILIFASQFHVMLDHDPAGGGLENLMTIPMAIYDAFKDANGGLHQLAAATGAITIATIVLWGRFAPERLKFLPGPLLAIVLATLFAQTFALGIKSVQVPSNLLTDVQLPTMDWRTLLWDSAILIGAFELAAIASAETLLCATAVDQMQSGQRTNYDRELMAQGVGNVTCGLLGALPMTGVIVRSSANIQAGGQTRVSAILHGVWLLLFVAALPFLLNYIPKAALGAILVYTGYKLVNWKAALELWKVDKTELLIFLATVVVIVSVDLLSGVLLGIALAAIKLLHTFSYLEVDFKQESPERATLNLRGSCTFVRLPLLAETLEQVPAGTELHVDFVDVDYIDHACLDLLMNWSKQHEQTGGQLVMDWESLRGRFYRDGRTKMEDRENRTDTRVREKGLKAATY